MHNDAQISNAQIEQDTTADENLISCIDNPYFCSVGNIPNNFYDEYVNIEKSVTQNDFSLQARVIAGLNMASAVSFACNSKINTYTKNWMFDLETNAMLFMLNERPMTVIKRVLTKYSQECLRLQKVRKDVRCSMLALSADYDKVLYIAEELKEQGLYIF